MKISKKIIKEFAHLDKYLPLSGGELKQTKLGNSVYSYLRGHPLRDAYLSAEQLGRWYAVFECIPAQLMYNHRQIFQDMLDAIVKQRPMTSLDYFNVLDMGLAGRLISQKKAIKMYQGTMTVTREQVNEMLRGMEEEWDPDALEQVYSNLIWEDEDVDIYPTDYEATNYLKWIEASIGIGFSFYSLEILVRLTQLCVLETFSSYHHKAGFGDSAWLDKALLSYRHPFWKNLDYPIFQLIETAEGLQMVNPLLRGRELGTFFKGKCLADESIWKKIADNPNAVLLEIFADETNPGKALFVDNSGKKPALRFEDVEFQDEIRARYLPTPEEIKAAEELGDEERFVMYMRLADLLIFYAIYDFDTPPVDDWFSQLKRKDK